MTDSTFNRRDFLKITAVGAAALTGLNMINRAEL
jgi:hypothetical protein